MITKKGLALAIALSAQAICAPALAAEPEDTLDRFRITEIMYKYAWVHNLTDPVGYSELFTEDGEFSGGGGPAIKGRAALAAMTESDRERFNPGAADGERSFMIMRTVITNPIVTLEGDGEASGSCYFQIIVERPNVGPDILAQGRYEDTYRKEDGEWKIAHRSTFMDMADMALAREVGVIE